MRGFLVASACFLATLAGGVGESPATSSCHPSIATTVARANLDRGRGREEVTATNVSCAHEYAYAIKDVCGYHATSHWLTGTGFLDERRVLDANSTRDGAELFYILRRGNHRAPDLGTAALVHLVRLAPDTCPVPRFVFLYRAAEPLLPPPPSSRLAGFDVTVVELRSRYRGREIRLTETFTRPRGEQKRTILLRYSPPADRYVVYSPKL